ncbi:MAG: hypothetical protein ACE5GE_02495 [Phycisphaerae bacterium]
MKRSKWTQPATLAIAGLMVPLIGCPKAEHEAARVATTKPAEPQAPPAPTPPAEPDPENRVEIRLLSLDEQQDGWLRIEAIRKGATGAWAGGSNPTPGRIVIDTENVDRFSINCAQLHIDWSGRVVLRIDGRSSELTRKKRPLIHFQRSPAGSWDVVRTDSD